jgi:hypothetical protein
MSGEANNTPFVRGLRGAAVSMFSILAYTEIVGLGAEHRQSHLSAYVVVLVASFAVHYVVARIEGMDPR